MFSPSAPLVKEQVTLDEALRSDKNRPLCSLIGGGEMAFINSTELGTVLAATTDEELGILKELGYESFAQLYQKPTDANQQKLDKLAMDKGLFVYRLAKLLGERAKGLCQKLGYLTQASYATNRFPAEVSGSSFEPQSKNFVSAGGTLFWEALVCTTISETGRCSGEGQ